MDATEFKAIVARFGEDNLKSLVFDNTARTIFYNDERQGYTHNQYFDDDLNCFIIPNKDPKGINCINVRHIENLQSMVFVENVADSKKIMERWISS